MGSSDSLRRGIEAFVKRVQPIRVKTRKGREFVGSRKASFPSWGYLEDLMARYTVESLVSASPESFERRIRGFLELRDHASEGFQDPDRQRDLSVQFHWGHDHDFGTFSLPGRMGDRHIWLLATFIDRFGALPRSLEGKRVLDVGCWTGGTSLLLAAMGAEVVAIEEVKKYVDCLSYLKQAFGVSRLHPRNLSLYECTGPGFDDEFDIVLFAGVLYHVTDPLLALRLSFNCLKDGGVCLMETAAIPGHESMVEYQGAGVTAGGSREDLSRGGWNWFKPTPLALERMMGDVGYTDTQVPRELVGRRAFGVGKRLHHVDMLRAGLSSRSVR